MALKPTIEVGELEGFVERLEAELYDETRFVTKCWAPPYRGRSVGHGDRLRIFNGYGGFHRCPENGATPSHHPFLDWDCP